MAIYTLKSLMNQDTLAKLPDGSWQPARPLSPFLQDRIRAAWMVLTGKADAVIWPGGQ